MNIGTIIFAASTLTCLTASAAQFYREPARFDDGLSLQNPRQNQRQRCTGEEGNNSTGGALCPGAGQVVGVEDGVEHFTPLRTVAGHLW